MKAANKRILTLLLLTSVATITGCKPSEPEIEHHQITGTIKHMKESDSNPGHWKVRMEFVNKSGNTVAREGDVTPETEILINGRVAKMSDVRIGEHADVLGRVVTTDQGKTITALKIKIARDESVSFGKPERESKPEKDNDSKSKNE